jgi:hypothetical protein
MKSHLTSTDKLNAVNERFHALRLEILKDDPQKLQSHLHTMFLFTERIVWNHWCPN